MLRHATFVSGRLQELVQQPRNRGPLGLLFLQRKTQGLRDSPHEIAVRLRALPASRRGQAEHHQGNEIIITAFINVVYMYVCYGEPAL